MQQHSAFGEALQRYPQVYLLDVPDFIGLGIVRYMPSYLVGQEGEEVRKEIAVLNSHLAQELSKSAQDFPIAISFRYGIGPGPSLIRGSLAPRGFSCHLCFFAR